MLARGELTQLEWLDLCASELDLDGVLFDTRHFARTDADYLAQLKKTAVDLGLTVTGLVALGSVPFSYLGARIAIRTKASRLERLYGIVLIVLGAFFLYQL